MSECPTRVREFVDAMVRAAREALAVELDFTPDTLPFLDHYLSRVQAPASRSRHKSKLRNREFIDLVAPMAGCYFGEVVRRGGECRWVLPGEDPIDWRIEFERCFLFFNPVGVAAESIARDQVFGMPGAFRIARHHEESMRRILDAQPKVREADFYSLTVRWETLDIISRHLIEDRIASGKEPEIFDEPAYALFLATEA